MQSGKPFQTKDVRMPELSGSHIFFGLIIAFLAWKIANRPEKPKRLPFWGAIVVGIAAAYAAEPVFAFVRQAQNSIPFLTRFTEGAIMIWLWVSGLVLIAFERKGAPRRVPIWAGIAVGGFAALIVPPIIDGISGSYQDASLRSDEYRCMGFERAEGTSFSVTNKCEEPIVVGLCLSNEKNPAPCSQTITLDAGATGSVDNRGEPLSSLPSNPDGYTITACRPPNRPSRDLKVGGRGHRGVCLP